MVKGICPVCDFRSLRFVPDARPYFWYWLKCKKAYDGSNRWGVQKTYLRAVQCLRCKVIFWRNSSKDILILNKPKRRNLLFRGKGAVFMEREFQGGYFIYEECLRGVFDFGH